ncbi:uncharacterized protein V1516DRAFT_713612 [Lipomyces oligophaga]|uniref:uncharacterized protein n=1 Tax=Lipomyces oligophaga TaxID=45792 RepID=UPI0034CDC877
MSSIDRSNLESQLAVSIAHTKSLVASWLDSPATDIDTSSVADNTHTADSNNGFLRPGLRPHPIRGQEGKRCSKANTRQETREKQSHDSIRNGEPFDKPEPAGSKSTSRHSVNGKVQSRTESDVKRTTSSSSLLSSSSRGASLYGLNDSADGHGSGDKRDREVSFNEKYKVVPDRGGIGTPVYDGYSDNKLTFRERQSIEFIQKQMKNRKSVETKLENPWSNKTAIVDEDDDEGSRTSISKNKGKPGSDLETKRKSSFLDDMIMQRNSKKKKKSIRQLTN